jgi:hypothetical protein
MNSTTPMKPCPIRRPASSWAVDLHGHRSLPQIAARVTRTSASAGSIKLASRLGSRTATLDESVSSDASDRR